MDHQPIHPGLPHSVPHRVINFSTSSFQTSHSLSSLLSFPLFRHNMSPHNSREQHFSLSTLTHNYEYPHFPLLGSLVPDPDFPHEPCAVIDFTLADDSCLRSTALPVHHQGISLRDRSPGASLSTTCLTKSHSQSQSHS